MFSLGRIYDFEPHSTQHAVCVDRLYPRGVSKARMATVLWLKALAPSTALRQWYHQDSSGRFDEMAVRYRQELGGEAQQQELARLRKMAAVGEVVLLTAVKQPQHSHVSVLLQLLNE